VNLYQSATFPVTNRNFTVNVPANCVFTLTGFDPTKIAVSVAVTNPASGVQYIAPATIPLAAAAATTTGSISNVTFYNGATQIGASRSTPGGMNWSNVGPGTYVLSAAAADTMGHTNLSSNVTVTVTGPPVQVVMTPTNASLIPNGQQQFTATVVDALGNPVSPQPALAWSAGGGLIDPDGWFLAGGSVGGPFSVVATNNGLSSSASLNIVSNVNVAPLGIGYIWYNLYTNTANTPQTDAPRLNDGDITTAISLLAAYDGSTDMTNAYEAAGVIWPSPQFLTNVVFFNAPTIGANGTFVGGFQLQFTTNGSTWFSAGPQWTLSPAYGYNTSSSSTVKYTFSGGPTTVLGFRCAGMVNTGGNSSDTYATEVQAYAAASPPPPFQTTVNKKQVVVSWASALTNCVLQSTPDLMTPWATVTNVVQYNGAQTGVTIQPTNDQQFFRLYFP
jgi:hypothetical protein